MFDLTQLNPEQRLAVKTKEGPVLILAGAGTGKTRVITYRIAHLVRSGVSPEHLLALTFTNKAAREMQARIQPLLPRPKSSVDGVKPARPTICTFHSLCVRILRRHAERLGYKRNFVIYDESEQLSAIKKVLSHVSDREIKIDPHAVLGLLSRLRNADETATEGSQSDLGLLAARVRSRYESALRACNAMDFDDLILLTRRLFDEHADVLDECRRRYRYVMVDEYQDTNAAQFRLVHALTSEHRNFCVVGDDDQSIYGWRGAEIANLLDMERYYPEVKVIKLEQNYRSTETILEAANAVIRNNSRRRPKKLWSARGRGEPIVLHAFETEEEEAKRLVEEIEYRRQLQRIPWAHQAILFRTNSQSRPLETALRQARVRYHLVGGQSFFDRREVRDLMAYLKMLVNPDDDISLLRIANVPARGLSDVTMERLLAASHERRCSVYAAMKAPAAVECLAARSRQSVESFVAFVDQTRQGLLEGASGSLRAWAERMLEETGYLKEIPRWEKNAENAASRVQNLRDLVAGLDKVATSHAPVEGLQSFLEDLTLDAERESEDDSAGDAVTLITMHSCKGLEFPHVYVAGLEDGLLPHARSKEEGTIDEERRLFYVALTRAQRTLTLSHCAGRTKYGRLTPCHPSRFLQELPPDLLDNGGSREPVSREVGRDFFEGLRAVLD